MSSKVLRSAAVTAGSLLGGMVVGFLAGFAVQGLPVHLPQETMVALASVTALVGIIGGGALWGNLLARVNGQLNRRRMTIAGGLSFGPVVIAVGFLLASLERAIVEEGRGPELPVHVVFTLLFVPATLLVAAGGGTAIGLAVRDRSLAAKLSIGCGLAGASAFLLVNVSMDALGWRVGAPGAAARATMLTVTLLGSLVATLVAGAVLGFLLERTSPQPELAGYYGTKERPNRP